MKSFSSKEVIVVILLLLIVSAFLMYILAGNVSDTKIDTFKKNAISFSNIVSSNSNIFSTESVVYLQSVIDEGFLSSLKSPFSSKDCNASESKVNLTDGLVTLKCDNYLLENYDINDNKAYVYKVSEWGNEKISNGEKKELYNCYDYNDNSMISDDYVEKQYLIYLVNKKYGTSYYDIDSIDTSLCELKKDYFYRKKELVKNMSK